LDPDGSPLGCGAEFASELRHPHAASPSRWKGRTCGRRKGRAEELRAFAQGYRRSRLQRGGAPGAWGIGMALAEFHGENGGAAGYACRGLVRGPRVSAPPPGRCCARREGRPLAGGRAEELRAVGAGLSNVALTALWGAKGLRHWEWRWGGRTVHEKRRDAASTLGRGWGRMPRAPAGWKRALRGRRAARCRVRRSPRAGNGKRRGPRGRREGASTLRSATPQTNPSAGRGGVDGASRVRRGGGPRDGRCRRG